MAEDKPNPSARSGERQAMDAAWTLISDVLAGAVAIREKGETYLPKYEGESVTEYGRRKKTAPWRPEFADALRALASKPFAKDVGFTGDPVPRVKDLAEDIDGRGNSQTAFAREAFGKGIAKGLHVILVDYPAMHGATADGEAPARALTVAEERAAGARPYWLHVEADDILALYTRWEGGREIIEHLRFRECAVERDGFGERKVERVRVYEPGRWAVWEEDAKTKAWAETGHGTIARGGANTSSVPAVLFFTGERLGEMRVRPPLADLAQLQIELYQALSRQDEVLTFASSPMLTANGLAPPQDGEPIAVGPKTILYAPGTGEGANPSWDYINPNPANIEQIRSHATSIVTDMRRLGMQPLTPQSGTPTATGQSIEAAKAHSAVQAWALGLKDALEQAWVFTCEWLGEATEVEVAVSTDFSVVPFAQAPLTALKDARAAKDISQRTFWDGLKRFDVLPADFDAEKEEETLALEAEGLEGDDDIDPRTGRPLAGDAAAPSEPDELQEDVRVAS